MVAILVVLPLAWLNQPYHAEPRWQAVSGRCGQPIATAQLASGRIPPGLALTAKGELGGTPTEPGDYRFTLELSDGCTRRLETRELRVTPAPILTAEAERLEFRCIHGAPAFTAGRVRISGSAPGRPYSVEILEGPWLRATPRAGVAPADASAFDADTLTLSIDPGQLSPGVHTARLRVSTWEGANAPELAFQLRVDSVQSILAPVTAPPPLAAPFQLPVIELPSPRTIVPPAAPRPAPPRLKKPRAKSASQAPAAPATPTYTRSRVLPFPKVKLPDRSTPILKEAPPERTKPSAMPPPPNAAAAAKKPAAAH